MQNRYLRLGARKSSNILPISTLFRSPKKEEAPSSSSSFSSDKGSSLDRLFIIFSAATFVKISSSSSSVVPLNRASKSSNENYPNHRIRSPKAATKKKRAHKRCPLLDSPRGQTRQTKRGRGGLSAFMAETCSRRRIALDSTRIARINPFLRTTIEIGNMERGEGTVPHPHA